MPTTDQQHRARSILITLIERASCLQQLLTQERGILGKRDGAAIEQSAAEKLTVISSIETCDHELTGLLDQLTDSSASHTREDQIESLGLTREQHRLNEVLEECRHLNRVNGSIIIGNRHYTLRILQLLRGETTHDTIYGPEGETEALRGYSMLAEA